VAGLKRLDGKAVVLPGLEARAQWPLESLPGLT